MMYILFGPPGVGKTYVGQLISDTFGHFFFDADQLIDEELRTKIQSNNYTQEDRENFIEKLIAALVEISKNTKKDIVIAEAFTKNINRKRFVHKFPKSKFIYINASKNVAEMRMQYRLMKEKHVIEHNSFERLWDEFELPADSKYPIIDNIQTSNHEILRKFVQLTKKD